MAHDDQDITLSSKESIGILKELETKYDHSKDLSRDDVRKTIFEFYCGKVNSEKPEQSKTERKKWLENAIYDYIKNHKNCFMLDIVAHFKELLVNHTLLSLRKLVEDGKVEETQIIQHTYRLTPLKKDTK